MDMPLIAVDDGKVTLVCFARAATGLNDERNVECSGDNGRMRRRRAFLQDDANQRSARVIHQFPRTDGAGN